MPNSLYFYPFIALIIIYNYHTFYKIFTIISNRKFGKPLNYFNYGLLYQIRFHRDSDIVLHYYYKAIEYGNWNRNLFWMTAHHQNTNLLTSMERLEEAIGQFEEILIRLTDHGYNMELEGVHPRQRIRELRDQLS